MSGTDPQRQDPSYWVGRVLPAARGPLGMALMALAVGVGGALASVVFLWLINRVTDLSGAAVRLWGWPALVAGAAAGGLAVGLLVH